MNVHKTWSKYHAIWGHPLHILYHWHNLHGGCAISWNGIHTNFVCVCMCVCFYVSHACSHPSIHSFNYLSVLPSMHPTYPIHIHSSNHLFFYLILPSEICDHLIFVPVIKQFLPFYIHPLSAVHYCFFTGW